MKDYLIKNIGYKIMFVGFVGFIVNLMLQLSLNIYLISSSFFSPLIFIGLMVVGYSKVVKNNLKLEEIKQID